MRYFLLSVIVGLLPSLAGALTPVEGILLGDAVTEIQNDPLKLVFTDIHLHGEGAEFRKVKNYQAVIEAGTMLVDQCSMLGAVSYPTPWGEKQAKRSVAAALQYIGLDTSIKAIGAYAKNLQVSDTEYQTLVDNITRNYCSENVSVMSLKTIKKSLEHYYQNPDPNILPNVDNSPYVTEAFRTGSISPETRSREFSYAIKNFRAFCSWGGSTEDLRLLPPYLKNPFIMSFIQRNMSGFRYSWNEQRERMAWQKDPSKAVMVVCTDLICRQVPEDTFQRDYPKSTGSTGVGTDINKLFCQSFRYLDYDQKNTIPEVKEWIKGLDIEEPFLETSFFVSLMTGVPDPFMIQTKYSDIPAIVKSSVDERWTRWSRESLQVFSRNLLFEESLKVKVSPRRPLADVRNDFMINFHVTLGEMDRIMRGNDKIGVSFDMKFSKSYLRSIIKRYNEIAMNLDVEKKKTLMEDLSRYVYFQVRSKEKLFTQRLWDDNFSTLIADELLGQILSYQGSFFEGYSDEMITVPVRFNYGVFALSYMRYRSQVAKGSDKLNL